MARISPEQAKEFYRTRGSYDIFPVDNAKRMAVYDTMVHVSIWDGFAYYYENGAQTPVEPDELQVLIDEAKDFTPPPSMFSSPY